MIQSRAWFKSEPSFPFTTYSTIIRKNNKAKLLSSTSEVWLSEVWLSGARNLFKHQRSEKVKILVDLLLKRKSCPSESGAFNPSTVLQIMTERESASYFSVFKKRQSTDRWWTIAERKAQKRVGRPEGAVNSWSFINEQRPANGNVAEPLLLHSFFSQSLFFIPLDLFNFLNQRTHNCYIWTYMYSMWKTRPPCG